MGTLIVLAVVMWGVFMGIVLYSLLSMAQKGEQIYERLHGEEEIGPLENACLWPQQKACRRPATLRRACRGI
jgi:hypothetical protein